MIRNFLRKFMVGRYGPDHLNVAMIIISLVLSLLNSVIFKFALLTYISYAILTLAIIRMLSRNITRRRAENDRFIRYWWPIKTRISRAFANIRYGKTHRFLKCPSCGNTLRVPKGKGKIQITCPKCGERFMKKT